MQAKNIIILAIIIIVLVLLFQNLNAITIHVFFWQFGISLLLVILISFILGIMLGWLLKSGFAKQKAAKQKTVL